MGDPGAAGTGSSAGTPAGAVVVPVEAASAAAVAPAAAPPPAGAAAAGARTAWARVSARVTWAGAAAAPPAGTTGVLPRAAAAARAPPAWTRLSARLALAAALFLLGCAAVGLAFFAMMLPPADSRLLGKACTPPTNAEVAGLRTASEYLLLPASAQVLAATMGLLVPAWPVAVFGVVLGWLTAYSATDVLWMLVACHGSAHGALAFHFWLFYAVLWAALAVGAVVSLR